MYLGNISKFEIFYADGINVSYKGLMKVKTILSIIALMLMFGAFGQINTVIDSLEFELKIAKEDTLKVKNLNLLSDQYFAFGKYDLAINNSAHILTSLVLYRH